MPKRQPTEYHVNYSMSLDLARASDSIHDVRDVLRRYEHPAEVWTDNGTVSRLEVPDFYHRESDLRSLTLVEAYAREAIRLAHLLRDRMERDNRQRAAETRRSMRELVREYAERAKARDKGREQQ